MDNEILKPNFFEWTVPYLGINSYYRRSFQIGANPPGYTQMLVKLTAAHIIEILSIMSAGVAIGAGLEKLLN